MNASLPALGQPSDPALAAFFDLPVAVCVLDRDLRFVAVNDAMAAMNGLPREQHLGRLGPDVLPDIDADAWASVRAVIATGVPLTVLVRGRTPASGDLGAWQEQFHPWRDRASGEVLGVIATAIDVTAQQRLEAAAQRRHEQLVGLAHLAADLVGLSGQAEVAGLLCRHAATILGASAAAVAIGSRSAPVRVIASFGYSGEDQLAQLSDGTALADTARTGVGHALTLGPDWDREFPRGAALHRAAGLQATVTTPLSSADETIGALGLSFARPPLLTDDDDATLAALASIGGQAMERARATDERRRSAQLREAFIDVMAHELKTPLATIYGGLQTVSVHGASLKPEVREDLVADATAEAHRLVRLVDNLVVMSRLERGVDIDLTEPLMLSHVTRAIVDTKVLTLGAPITVTIPKGVPPVRGETAYVEQVLRNLLTNALKYAKPPYDVILDATDAEVEVRVLDRGPGLPPDAEKLFSLYYRDASAAKHASGSGIGLFVCRELVRLMGGRTWAANRPDGGAEFGFSLPVWHDEEP